MTYKEEEQGAYNKKQVNIPRNGATTLKRKVPTQPCFLSWFFISFLFF